MSFDHRSGLPGAYDRGRSASEDRKALVWQGGAFVTGADLNEIQTLADRRFERVSRMVARNGDRIAGADIIVDVEGESVTVTAGRIYVAGDARVVSAAVLTDVPMTGDVSVGVRIVRAVKTYEDDPTLLGLHPGAISEGQECAAREYEALVWGHSEDGLDDPLSPVYVLRDGVALDLAPPPALSQVRQLLAEQDRDAHGNYVVDGCDVRAIGRDGADQVFTINAGRANIQGFKRVRNAAMRFRQVEEPDLENVAAEPATYTAADGDPMTIVVQRPPIATVSQVVVVKRASESVIRGATPGGADALSNPAVVAIESVTQGATTFVSGDDYEQAGDNVSWAPAGDEPAGGSTYLVTYRYNVAVTPDEITDTTIVVSGGVNGTTALVSYASKIPRIDVLGLDRFGAPVYIKGVSARRGALAPQAPSEILKLAEVWNDWLDVPVVVNNGTRNVTYDRMQRLFGRLIDVLETFDRSEAERDILARDPVAKRGIFTDAFVDDRYRDQGEAQTAAIARGILQLPVALAGLTRLGTSFETLPYVEEIVLRQDLATSGMLINPYMNFTAMPAALRLEPAVDFWTESLTTWTSGVTREFTTAPGAPPGDTSFNEIVATERVPAQTLRSIEVSFLIDGFGAGENLERLVFDGIDVTPPDLTADGAGQVTGAFTIPAGVPSGRRRVRAEGEAGSFAEALYLGEGVVETSVMRRVTLVAREAPPPQVIIQQTLVQQLNDPWVGQEGGNENADGSMDPLAQTFVLFEARHVVGVDFQIAAIGDRSNGIRVQLAGVFNGYPTRDVFAEAFISMATPEVGDWLEARFDAPVFLPADREFCFVILTDDAEHAVSVAQLGDIFTDPVTGRQTRVGAQPYTTGVLFASANRSAWTPIQDADMAFRIVAADYTHTERVVTLGTVDLDEVSDIIIRGTVELPTEAAGFRYEIVRAGGQVIALAPGQEIAFSEYLTETVTIRAVLRGTSKIAPMLFPGTLVVAGRIATTGNYVSRVFQMGSPVEVKALFAALAPVGSGVTVDVDDGAGDWTALTLDTTEVLGGGWNQPRYVLASHSAAVGRIRLTLTGSPAARPQLARLRAYSI
ncbi:MAG: DUF4815 domain-containing protein [Salinarimonadaceae bacterium]|nr:MAG: DUF4815 domain-containing protein [Salinarimonadaceae bacterium]